MSNHSHSSAAEIKEMLHVNDDELAKDMGIFNVDLSGGSLKDNKVMSKISASQDTVNVEKQRHNSFEAAPVVQIG